MQKRMNVAALYGALDKVRRAKEWSWYKVSQDTGIPQSTFTRLKKGKEVNATKLCLLAEWCGSDIAKFFTSDAK